MHARRTDGTIGPPGGKVVPKTANRAWRDADVGAYSGSSRSAAADWSTTYPVDTVNHWASCAQEVAGHDCKPEQLAAAGEATGQQDAENEVRAKDQAGAASDMADMVDRLDGLAIAGQRGIHVQSRCRGRRWRAGG